jgi:putative ABC transport system permease protein
MFLIAHWRGIGGSFRLIAFAIRNSCRRRARLALTLVTLAAGGLFFLSALNIRASMVNTLDHMFAGRKFDLSVGFANPYEFEKIQKAVSNTSGVIHAEGWFQSEATLPSGGRFTVTALPPDTQLLDFEIIEGRKLTPQTRMPSSLTTRWLGESRSCMLVTRLCCASVPAERKWRVVGVRTRGVLTGAVGYVPLSFYAAEPAGNGE